MYLNTFQENCRIPNMKRKASKGIKYSHDKENICKLRVLIQECEVCSVTLSNERDREREGDRERQGERERMKKTKTSCLM
jgi:hypothetical protein